MNVDNRVSNFSLREQKEFQKIDLSFSISWLFSDHSRTIEFPAAVQEEREPSVVGDMGGLPVKEVSSCLCLSLFFTQKITCQPRDIYTQLGMRGRKDKTHSSKI